MPDNADDRSLAPRRTLNGPVLPPPPPELEEQARKAEADAAAAREAQQRKEADKQAKAQAKAEAREAQSQARAEAKQAKAAKADEARRAEETRRAEEARTSQAAAREQARPVPATSPTSRPPGQPAASAPSAQPARSSQAGIGTTTLPVTAPVVATTAGQVASGGPAGEQKKARGGRRPSARRTRRAQLRLVQVDAWSVMKTSFLLSIALGIVLVVAVAIIMSVLSAAGVWTSINSIVQQAVGTEGGQTFDIQKYVGASRVLGFTMIVAVVDVILITAIATLGAFLYNLSAALLGGIEVTLAEDS